MEHHENDLSNQQQETMNGHSRLSPGWRTVITVILAMVFFLSFLGFTLGLVVQRDLLAPELYTQALATNNVYERVYTELLADPAVQDQFTEITGIDMEVVSGELYAQIVAALYLIIPPTEMQKATEGFFTGLTAYLSGDVPELDEDLNLGQSLTAEVLADRIVRAATAVIVEAVDKATPIIQQGTERLDQVELLQYMDQLGQGRLAPIPSKLLRTTVAGLSQVESDRLVNLLLGPAADTASQETRLQIEAALAADDLTGAIALAATERLSLRVSSAVAKAETRLAESPALNSISAAAAALGETRDSIVAGLNTVRDVATALQKAMIPLAVIMLVSLLSLVWLHSHDLRSALRAAGWTLFGSAGIAMLLWLVIGIFLRSTLQTRLAGQAGPAGLDSIIDDVVASLSQGVWESVWQSALFFLLVGLITLAFGYSRQLLAFLYRLLAPVWRHKWWVLAGVFTVFVLIPVLLSLITTDARAANQPCNGYVELCDRPANEVAYATSHNAMSIAEYRWIWPMHDGTITEQLNAGVRGLLIDTHYLDKVEQQQEVISGLPEGMQEVAKKAITLIVPPPEEGNFLCHQLCGFGYTQLGETLTEIRTWLEDNPREVLFIVIQDEISSRDTYLAIEKFGLLPHIYNHPAGESWPTLRQMIDSGKRLVIMAENEGPPPDWYTNVWQVTEETPYTFIVEEQFSCEPNRGDTGKPFFLLNHWIQRGAPNRVDAAIVNEYDYLLARARQCEEERGQMPNFIAVNWYRQGDLFKVVDTLNGVDTSQNQAP